MTASPLDTVMAAVASAVDSAIGGVRVFGFPPKSATAPFCFVNPTRVDYDLTYGRGFDRFELEVYVAVAAQVDRASWSQITDYADGASVKAAIDGIGPGYRTTSVTFGEIQLAGGTYLGAVFTVDVAA